MSSLYSKQLSRSLLRNFALGITGPNQPKNFETKVCKVRTDDSNQTSVELTPGQSPFAPIDWKARRLTWIDDSSSNTRHQTKCLDWPSRIKSEQA